MDPRAVISEKIIPLPQIGPLSESQVVLRFPDPTSSYLTITGRVDGTWHEWIRRVNGKLKADRMSDTAHVDGTERKDISLYQIVNKIRRNSNSDDTTRRMDIDQT